MEQKNAGDEGESSVIPERTVPDGIDSPGSIAFERKCEPPRHEQQEKLDRPADPDEPTEMGRLEDHPQAEGKRHLSNEYRGSGDVNPGEGPVKKQVAGQDHCHQPG